MPCNRLNLDPTLCLERLCNSLVKKLIPPACQPSNLNEHIWLKTRQLQASTCLSGNCIKLSPFAFILSFSLFLLFYYFLRVLHESCGDHGRRGTRGQPASAEDDAFDGAIGVSAPGNVRTMAVVRIMEKVRLVSPRRVSTSIIMEAKGQPKH